MVDDSQIQNAFYVTAVLMFGLGLWIGIKLEAHSWRDKAKGYFRMASGGKLYRVIEDNDHSLHS